MGHLRCLTIESSLDDAATLAYLLESDPRVSSVRAVSDIAAAVDALEHQSADAVFVCLAMHTPQQLRTLTDLPWRPTVVAVAPTPEWAMTAYEIGAVDFLLKPPKRAAVERAIDRLATSHTRQPSGPARVRIPIQRADGVAFVDARDIYYVETDGDYTKVVSIDGSDNCRFSLNALSDRLAESGFVRIHRRWLVSAARVEALSQTDGRVVVSIAGCELPVARRLIAEVRARLT